jgi:hypothetical protein
MAFTPHQLPQAELDLGAMNSARFLMPGPRWLSSNQPWHSQKNQSSHQSIAALRPQD